MIFCYDTVHDILLISQVEERLAGMVAEKYPARIYFEAELAYETNLVMMMTKWQEKAIDSWAKANPRFGMDPAIKDNLMRHLNKGVIHIDPGVINYPKQY